MTINGEGDDLIKPEGIESYTFHDSDGGEVGQESEGEEEEDDEFLKT